MAVSRILDRIRERTSDVPWGFLGLVLAALVLGLAHHVDHVVRGNHVGWPVTGEVTPFTFSLLAYPVVAFGVYLGFDRRGLGYWVAALAGLAGFVALTHFGPVAVEPLEDIVGVYESPWVAGLALVVLIGLLAALGLGALGALSAYRRTSPEGPGPNDP